MSDTIKLYDRIKELSYTMGVSDFSLAGPVIGFSSFSSVYNHGDITFYAATDGSAYEIGSGVFNSGLTGFSLVRFPISSSNNNQKISFNEGIKEVYVTYPATHAVYQGSGLAGFSSPQSSGLAYWKTSNMLQHDANLVWNDTDGYLGINTDSPDYGIDLRGVADQAVARMSGIVVGSSGVYFPPQNDGSVSYLGGRQLTHYEKNELDQKAYDNNLIDELTGSDAVLELSGVANQYVLFKKQNAGFVFAGPPSGCVAPCSPGYPSFRPLTAQDVPDIANISGILNNKIFAALTNIATASGALNTKINNVSGILSSDLSVVSGIVNNITTSTIVDICEGRLTLVSDQPITFTDQTNQSTVYYCPLSTTTNKISLYNGTSWQVISFSEKSLTLFALTNNTNYDIFGYLNGSDLEVELGQAWTNNNTRSQDLALKDNVLCKSGDLTRRYLGTIRTTSSSTTEDSLTKRFVWNANNRFPKKIKNNLGNFMWTYSTAQWRATRNIKSPISLIYGGIDSPQYKENIDIKAGLVYAGDGSVTVTTTTTTTTTTVAPETTTTTTTEPGATTTTTTTTSGPTINALYSWGRDTEQQLGDGPASSSQYNPVLINSTTVVGQIISNPQIDVISAGQYFSAAILLDGTLVTCGQNANGQLGNGDINTRNVFTSTTVGNGASQPFVKIACGYSHMLTIANDSTIWFAGTNSSGQLGDGSTSSKYVLIRQSLTEAWLEIAAGNNRSLGIKVNGTLWGWGNGSSLSLRPDLSNTINTVPLSLQSFIPAGVGTPTKIYCGTLHNVLITSTGNALVWGGSNTYGQLGIGTNTNPTNATYRNLKTISGYDSAFLNEFFIEAACGVSHTLLLAQSGRLYACGRSQFGQVGNGNNDDITSRFVLIGTDFSKIAAGAFHSVAIKNNGDLYAWGNNSFGQLGTGTININVPTLVSLSNIQKVACGYYHTLAIR